MAKYTSGIANDGDDLFTIVAAHLVTNGFTEVDVVNNSVDNRKIVYETATIFTGADCTGFLQINWDGTNFWVVAFTDYDTTTHLGDNYVGSNSQSNANISSSPFTYYLRANSVSFTMATLISSALYGNYFGFLRRGRPVTSDGITNLSAGIAAGVSSLPVNADMTGRLYVGQKISIVNRAGLSGDSNWGNAELLTVNSIGATSIGIVGVTTNAYTSGSVVGADPFTLCVTDSQGNSPGGTVKFAIAPDGSTLGPGGISGAAGAAYFSVNINTDDPTSFDEYGLGGWFVRCTYAGNVGSRGTYYHCLSGGFGITNRNDVLDAGDGVVAATILHPVNANGWALLGG